MQHQFGGNWTEEKLTCLKKYLYAYLQIFSKNMQAKMLHTIYVDAFAGTGYRHVKKAQDNNRELPFLDDEEAISYQKGSAHLALELNPSFKEYLFIEQSPEYSHELEHLRFKFPEKRIIIVREDANTYLQAWCRQKDWRFTRAVIFLDPYGMQVEWNTIEAIAKTQAIDLWILFPLGQAVNRLLTENCPPKDAWADRLTKFFGSDDWKKAFYRTCVEPTLFGEETLVLKDADFASIEHYFIQRLKTIFPKVAENSLWLRNSRNVPIFLLCFAASNPKGAPTAVKIAQYILSQ